MNQCFHTIQAPEYMWIASIVNLKDDPEEYTHFPEEYYLHPWPGPEVLRANSNHYSLVSSCELLCFELNKKV